jgi:toxin ParE1/3/4
MNTRRWKVRLTPSAVEDFTGINRWTKRKFGLHQARLYKVIIKEAILALNAGPNILGVKQRDDFPPGILTLHVARQGRKGSHFIVFRVSGERTIDVLRILYDGMDLPSHV